ncbi:hypothetical protein MTO96_008596 [Rhipicephalus appendiculatus]
MAASSTVRAFRAWRGAAGSAKKKTRVGSKKKRDNSTTKTNIVCGNGTIMLVKNGTANPVITTDTGDTRQLALKDGIRSSVPTTAPPIANCGEARAGCRLVRPAPRLPQIRERAARSLSLVLVRTSWSAPWRSWFPMAPSRPRSEIPVAAPLARAVARLVAARPHRARLLSSRMLRCRCARLVFRGR